LKIKYAERLPIIKHVLGIKCKQDFKKNGKWYP
jgi:hypothetical protein